MKQNYNLLTSSTAFPHAWNTFFQKSKTKTTSLLVVLFTLLGFSDVFGQSPFVDNNTATPFPTEVEVAVLPHIIPLEPAVERS